MIYSADQEEAFAKCMAWRRSREPVFGLSGEGGSGKTTIAREALKRMGLNRVSISLLRAMAKDGEDRIAHSFICCAPTNRAARQATIKGTPAVTIHSLCYSPLLNESAAVQEEIDALEAKMQDLQVKIDAHEDKEAPDFTDLCKKYHRAASKAEELNKPNFEFNSALLEVVSVLVIDEASMITPQMMQDLLSVDGLRIFMIGDSHQLGPIILPGAKYVDPNSVPSIADPDFELTTNHRQGHGELLAACRGAREGEQLEYGDREGVEVNPYYMWEAHLGMDEARFRNGMVIVDTNSLRQRVNVAIRATRGITDFKPRVGDKLLIKTNLRELGIYNNDLIEIDALDWNKKANAYQIDACTLLDTGEQISKPFLIYTNGLARAYNVMHIKASKAGIKASKLPISVVEYGFAITVHSAQGSESDDVTLISTPWMGGNSPEAKARFFYTSISRAQKTFRSFSDIPPPMPGWAPLSLIERPNVGERRTPNAHI